MGDEKGYTSSAPLRGKKGAEYEGGMRISFIASWGKVNKGNPVQQSLPILEGAVQQQMRTIMDIYPTVLSLAGASKPADYVIDGFNLATQLKGGRNTTRTEKMLMHFPHAHRGSYFTTYRDGDWKLIYYYNPQKPNRPAYELYDLKKDPVEIHNLATIETERADQMIKAMATQLEAEGAFYQEDAAGNPIKPIL